MTTATKSPVTSLGIVAYALALSERQNWNGRYAGLPRPIAFLEASHHYGAGGVQITLGHDLEMAAMIRRTAESHGMFVEGILDPPASDADLPRFEQEIQTALRAGARLARTVIIPGRRYEQFQSASEFEASVRQGVRMLERAEPVLARHGFKLAIENHKDQRIDERLALLKRLSSEYIGACIDVGNNIALLEDPLDTVRAFAPWAMTVHLKDHLVQENQQGFLLADTALGTGCLDLRAIIDLLRRQKPHIRFNLETITRDPLTIPALTAGYWPTLATLPARDLAHMLLYVKTHSSSGSLPGTRGLRPDQQVALEDRHVAQSIVHASESLHI